LNFQELGLSKNVLKGIGQLSFTNPTPIQERVIPLILAGTMDIVGLAQTGTGKTAAFGLPLLEKIRMDENRPQALILCSHSEPDKVHKKGNSRHSCYPWQAPGPS